MLSRAVVMNRTRGNTVIPVEYGDCPSWRVMDVVALMVFEQLGGRLDRWTVWNLRTQMLADSENQIDSG